MVKFLQIFLLWSIFEMFQIGYSEDYNEGDSHLFGMPVIEEEESDIRNFPLPPQHMLELYETMVNNINSGKQYQYMKYENANLVRSFSNKGQLDDEWYYFFDLKGSISAHEEVLGAEFLFSNNLSESLQENSFSFLKIQLFEGDGYESSRLIEERTASVNNSRWEEFEIKSLVEKWCDDPESNEGFTLKILDSTGENLPKNRVLGLQKDTESLLIVYSKNSRIAESTILNRELSGSIQANFMDNSETQGSPEEENSRSIRAASRRKTNFCAKYDFKIDFGEIGWLHWVIRPKWYNAYTCKGACVFGRNQNTTVHARMQSLVHHLGLSGETPCCVPTELEPLAILFYDKDSNPILAKFDEMIVAECGCR